MKPNETIIGKAVRMEYSEIDDRVFLVFEITDPYYKKSIKTDWTKDIEFHIFDKCLVGEKL